MEGDPRVSRQPCRHLWMFVGGIVVDDAWIGFPAGTCCLDGIEEADELLVPMALHVPADDLAELSWRLGDEVDQAAW